MTSSFWYWGHNPTLYHPDNTFHNKVVSSLSLWTMSLSSEALIVFQSLPSYLHQNMYFHRKLNLQHSNLLQVYHPVPLQTSVHCCEESWRCSSSLVRWLLQYIGHTCLLVLYFQCVGFWEVLSRSTCQINASWSWWVYLCLCRDRGPWIYHLDCWKHYANSLDLCLYKFSRSMWRFSTEPQALLHHM